MMSWVIFEADKLRPNMDQVIFKPLKAFDKAGKLKILKYNSEEEALKSLETETSKAYKAKNKNKKCTYTIIKIYEDFYS